MKATSKIMYSMATFLAVMSVIYVFATMYVRDSGSHPGFEWAGGVSLILATLLTLMLGGYLHFTENRIDILPEDWEEAEVADAAGTLGFFSPNSIWPAAMSGSVAVLGFGVIFLHYWLIAVGAALLIYTTTMLNLQYGMPKEKH
ncbi:cytochrome c oxidase subunit 4 [Corynebacterium pseudotuberculosis]|uniref:Cytochrome c oxidase polypeptide 4 n=1 Tax=Corynebacterium pseudotuberculosis 258 TaxID=1168865 RepID=A0AAU8PN93_CORPS|nr:cytochrome c oxidase subunit 4 [Corynebacterium pseudotuberculosis]AER69468.1 Cytochrome c oxidase polypeptide 4 [Corynebacterium pseudotuberculosis 1/06-A]AEQ06979.1 cytochrome-c oxidase [Corynebacterium pseudotuberculosis CIP 52.97]AFB72785.1 cytochrome-c oxidase [Corynebacterium pseudotuberculosis 316]AFH91250.1 cytochrome-c oxidase [Corynebacterium pseudotuberculosis 31]AFK17075.1 cytochrome-c oxidase [Corynebacterium pseudotuberculosis 258]